MSNFKDSPFIFFLTIEGSISKKFYFFDRVFKDLGYILVPVHIDQLQALLASTDQSQIMVLASVSDARELRLYNERVRGLLKYVLKSKRLTYMLISSFAKINDFKNFPMSKNYYFLKYPINIGELSKKIIRFHELKSNSNVDWPGGKRAGLGAIS